MTIKQIDKANTILKYADILNLSSYKPKKKKVLTIKNNENNSLLLKSSKILRNIKSRTRKNKKLIKNITPPIRGVLILCFFNFPSGLS